MWAAEGGHTELVKLLMEKGARINAKDRIGRTALSIATEKGHTAVRDLLQQR